MTSDFEQLQALTALAIEQRRISIEFDGFALFSVVAAVQLALRHPDLGDGDAHPGAAMNDIQRAKLANLIAKLRPISSEINALACAEELAFANMEASAAKHIGLDKVERAAAHLREAIDVIDDAILHMQQALR